MYFNKYCTMYFNNLTVNGNSVFITGVSDCSEPETSFYFIIRAFLLCIKRNDKPILIDYQDDISYNIHYTCIAIENIPVI